MTTSTAAPAASPAPARPVRPARSTDGLGVKAFDRLAATCVVLFALVWLVPLLWTFVTSLRPDGEITTDPVAVWSEHYSLDAYRAALSDNSIGWWYVNSFLVSTLAVVLTVVACSMIGFALARIPFRGRRGLTALTVAAVMMPGEAMVLPQYAEFRSLGLLGTYWALVLPAVASPVAVLVFRAFVSQVPEELFEAARLDGAGWWRIYLQVCMPLCRPAVSAVAILTFIGSWNGFLWPMLVMTQTRSLTVPVGLASLNSSTAIHYAETMASGVLGILPLLAVFLVLQRRIVEGVATSGLR